jgi:hypothetical protein
MQPSSSKQVAKSRTANIDPVIISNNLNSTLNHMVNVMEKSLDATSVTGPATAFAPTSQTAPLLSVPSQFLGPGLSSEEILQQAIGLTMMDGFLTEDKLLSASLFFTSSSKDIVRAARTFITLGNNWAVQCCFLLNQLNTAALLLGKGKGRDNDDDPML